MTEHLYMLVHFIINLHHHSLKDQRETIYYVAGSC